MKRNGQLAVYAVYYDDLGNIQGWSEKPFSPETDGLEELRTNLNLMLDALGKEIVEYAAPQDR